MKRTGERSKKRPGFREIMGRAFQEADRDNIVGRAAELAFFFLLGLFPMLIFVSALVGFLPGVQSKVLDSVAQIAPSEVMQIIRETFADISRHRSGSLLSLSAAGALWAASAGVAALMDVLNSAYGARDERSFLRRRIIAVLLTVGLSILAATGVTLIMFGDKLVQGFADSTWRTRPIVIAWRITDFVIGPLLLLAGIGIVYQYGPSFRQRWRAILPGSIFAVGAIIAGSLLVSAYLRIVPTMSATYGSLGALVVLMLWLYIAGLAILMGGEINSEIHKAHRRLSEPPHPATVPAEAVPKAREEGA